MPNKGRQLPNNLKAKRVYTSSNSHVPYILNGELYEIQTRDGENVTVKCCNCPPDRVYRGSVRSTGNFHMHIKRRHSALLGKLHEMKVTALLERRDRLRNTRRIGGLQSGNSNGRNVVNEERELKIKTVFKRHKQEQQEHGEQQEKQKMEKPNTTEIAVPNVKVSVATNMADNKQDDQDEPVDMELENFQDDNNEPPNVFNSSVGPYVTPQENVVLPPLGSFDVTQQQLHGAALSNFINGGIPSQLCNLNALGGGGGATSTMMANTNSIFNPFGQIMNNVYNNNINNTSTTTTNPNFNQFANLMMGNTNVAMQQPNLLSSFGLPFGLIKPELLLMAPTTQPQQQQQQFSQAVDLSMSTQQSHDSHSSCTSPDDCQVTPTVTISEPTDARMSNATDNIKDLYMLINNSLRDIQAELNIRNQIESKRIIFDVAKFKFQHPEFGFQF